jgi:hypothetical protein
VVEGCDSISCDTPIPEVVPVHGCVASALFAPCSVSDAVPCSADTLIAKGLSWVYETDEHLDFTQIMEHAFAVVASVRIVSQCLGYRLISK